MILLKFNVIALLTLCIDKMHKTGIIRIDGLINLPGIQDANPVVTRYSIFSSRGVIALAARKYGIWNDVRASINTYSGHAT